MGNKRKAPRLTLPPSKRPKAQLKGKVSKDEWIMEKILAVRSTDSTKNGPPAPTQKNDLPNRMVYFLVKWDGWPKEESTWESWINLRNSQDVAKKFLRERGKQIVWNKDAREAWLEDIPKAGGNPVPNTGNEGSDTAETAAVEPNSTEIGQIEFEVEEPH